MKTMRLTGEETEFLTLVTQAAFTNPFSEDRFRLDEKISGLPAGADSARSLAATLSRVQDFLSRLAASGRQNVALYAEPDRELVLNAHLFGAYHRFSNDFDSLIAGQISAGDALCPVPFVKDALEQMAACGIGRPEALRYFAMFYQLRRAYYFIAHSLVGNSPSMKQLRVALWRNVFTHDIRLYERHLWNRMEDFSTLLLGETGSGKGAAAVAIGRSGFIPFDDKRQCFSESFMRSFLAINLSQFPESLIESELFGHRKGAFTGAVEAHHGIFSRCSPHGAIFLDEIGEVSVPVQIKLLQVLQERVFSPVGSHEKQRFNGRVIAATNRPIRQLRRDGGFRDDFFYRLCSDVITVPPLRQRLQEDPAELDILLAHTIRRIIGVEAPDVARMVREVVDRDLGRDYPWTGNVRELEQCVRRVLLTKSYAGDRAAASADLESRIAESVAAGSYTAQGLLADYCTLLYRRHGTYEEVARRTGLDRRTAKKHVHSAE